LIDLVYPRQVVLVTTRHMVKDRFSTRVNEQDNIIAVDWHMPVSFDPKMYAIAISKKRFSLQLIQESGVFCINMIPFTLQEQVQFIGKHSGQHINKFERTGLIMEECSTIECGKIKQAVGHIECHVEKELDVGDHIIIVGKVTHHEEKDHIKRLFHKKLGDHFTTTVE